MIREALLEELGPGPAGQDRVAGAGRISGAESDGDRPQQITAHAGDGRAARWSLDPWRRSRDGARHECEQHDRYHLAQIHHALPG